MAEIHAERSGSILRVELNRPEKKNAMTSNMYVTLAEIFDGAAKDDQVRVVLWHGAGDTFCAGNDVVDFLKNPPMPGEEPQAHLMKAFVNFDKPIVAAVHGAAIGGGATMLTHCDFTYVGETTKFQMPFINLGIAPEFGTSFSLPAWLGHFRASELLLLGVPYGAARAAELGLVTRVVPDEKLLATALETAQQLAAKPGDALRTSKRLMKRSTREQMEQAMRVENEAYAVLLRSPDAREALTAFLEKRKPDFTKPKEAATA